MSDKDMVFEKEKKSTVPVSVLELLQLLHRALELNKTDVAKAILKDAIRQMESKRDSIEGKQKESVEGEEQEGERASP